MKRRNSKNLTFDDMDLYATFRENIEEAIRLRECTRNTFLISLLSNFIKDTGSKFVQWLDEEVE